MNWKLVVLIGVLVLVSTAIVSDMCFSDNIPKQKEIKYCDKFIKVWYKIDMGLNPCAM